MDVTNFFLSNISLDKIPISSEVTQKYIYIAITIIIAIIADNLLRSFIRVPKRLDNKRARTFVSIFQGAITAGVYILAIHIISIELGINITPILASAGVIGVFIGIGARSIIEDLLSGLFLLSQDKIAVGDYVKIEDLEGYIETIDLRTVTIRGETGALYIIPNGIVKKLINYSRHRAHVIIDLPVKSNQKIEKVTQSVQDAITLLQKDEEIGRYLLSDPIIDGIEDFKAMNGMTFRVTITTSHVMRWKVGRKYRYYIKQQFEKNKIEMA